MGNENSAEGMSMAMRRSQYNDKRRKTTLSGYSDVMTYGRSHLDSPRRSLGMGDVSERDEQYEKSRADGEEGVDRTGSHQIGENDDRILERLNRRNEQLRKELREISLMLSEKLEKRKMVVKKKYESSEPVDTNASKGVKRELENAYKQIDMYKRQIQALRSKQEGDKGYIKIDRLENDIATKDREIEVLMDKIRACRNIKKGQEKVISKDLNEDQMGMIDSYRQQIETLKTKLKQISKRDRVREQNYKKQQAYLYEVEKKLRALNGDYFPDIKKEPGQSSVKKRFDVQSEKADDTQKKTLPSAKEFSILQAELTEIKKRHEEYHKKIDNMILLKNKHTEERESVESALKQKAKVIEGLKLKVEELKKLGKVNKKNLFGSDETEQQNSIEGGAEQPKQQEQSERVDAFNIDHLIANIPKPNRPARKSTLQEDNSLSLELMRADGSADENRHAKVWNASKNRREEKGEHGRGEITFDDKTIFPEGAEPKIVGINMWQTSEGDITGLQAIYTVNGDIKQGLKSSNPNGNLNHFDLKVPDYIKSIGGSFGANGVLEYIVFVSKGGKVGRFGNVSESQKQFNFDIQENERPYLISGASRLFGSDVRVSMLNVDICRE